jgi:hypothetical protein
MKNLFHSLIGIWDIKRTLGNYGTAKGIATFTLKNSNSILYREDLNLKFFKFSAVKAYKEYIYNYNEDNNKIIKHFTDNKVFYELNFIADKFYKAYAGSYICGKDTYKATYNFLKNDKFVLSYEVKGLNKDYIIETEFTKLEDSHSWLIAI